MKKTLRELRPVRVVGIGLHKYQHLSDTTYVTLGLTAVRAALDDAGIEWPAVEFGIYRHRAGRNGGVTPDASSSGRDRNRDGAGGERIGLRLDRVSSGLP